MYNCIIFDVDGTLIDNKKAVFEAYQEVIFKEFGRRFTNEELKPAYGVTTRQALINLGFKDIDAALNAHHKALMEAFANAKPFEGIENVLKELRKLDVVKGIVTSRNRAEVYDDVCLQKYIKYFDYVVCSDDTKRHKPNPDPVLKLLEMAGVKAANTIYIGDTNYDAVCAKKAGTDFALALWEAGENSGIEADYYLKNPGELLKLL